MGCPWTKQEIEILKDNYLSCTDQELCLLMPQHSKKSIQSKRVDLNLIKPKTRSKYTYCDFERLMGERGYSIISSPDEYKNAGSIMKYICPHHKDVGIQEITLGRLLEGKGCTHCGRERTVKAKTKPITKKWINEAHQICENRDWTFVSLDRNTNNQGRKGVFVSFICNRHAQYGIQNVIWANFKRNKKCKYCQHKDLSKEDISVMAKQGSPHIEILSDYSKINDIVECVCTKHNRTNVIKVRDIIKGSACYQCGLEKLSQFHFISEKEIDERIFKLNPNARRISEYNGINLPMTYRCEKCGYQWTGLLHTSNHCPNCEKQFSSWGERYVGEILDEKCIEYEAQKKFDKCKNIKFLPFDFYLPKYNMCIEYQGIQHFEPCDYFGGEDSFVSQQTNDNIKREFCKTNNITLIEIPYTCNTKDKIRDYINEKIQAI